MRSAEELMHESLLFNNTVGYQKREILDLMESYASQFREPSTQGGEEKIFMEPESTYSLMTSSDPEKVEKGKVLRVQELALQLVKKNKRIQVLEEALKRIDKAYWTDPEPNFDEIELTLKQALNPKD